MENSSPRAKRLTYLINKEFQFRHLRVLVLFVLLGVVVGAGAVYHSLWSYMKETGTFRHEVFAALLNAVGLSVLLELVLLVPLCMVASVFVSHKIAGPLFRIEKTVASLAEGNFGDRIKLRRNDELTSLAEALNRLSDRLDGLKKQGKLKW